MIIRAETAADFDEIHRITEAAFAEASHASHTEAEIIRALRQDGDLTLSLVAEDGGEIVGYIAFSPVTISGRHDGWYGLGPVAVRPDKQSGGIGSALLTRGLAELRARGARGCALLGNPAFYGRFGFESDGTITYSDLPVRYIQRLVFAGDAPSGEITYAPAFDLAAP